MMRPRETELAGGPPILLHNGRYNMDPHASRRSVIAGAMGAIAMLAGPDKFRVAVMGHTGQGNYGHGIDLVWTYFDEISVVAVADPDAAGRAAAQKRIGAARGYSDYREMLRRETPHLVGIGPRTLVEREQMVIAAAQAGAHIFCEKPFAGSPSEADRMVEAVQKGHRKLQMAHQMRVSPYMRRAKAMVDAGEIGDIQEVRTRGKEDRRAGGEDLMVLGPHLFDMMRFFLGDPKWVMAHVTKDGEELAPQHVTNATEPVGPVAGNQMGAMFAFGNGVHGYFASRATAQTDPLRFGMWLYGSKGVLFVPMAIYPEGGLFHLPAPSWLPDSRAQWTRVEVKLDADAQAVASRAGHLTANVLLVSDLLQSIEHDRKPCCNEEDGRWTIEMVHGIYQSQKSRGRIDFPLKARTHALEG
jgi:predicted dehydrogenase